MQRWHQVTVQNTGYACASTSTIQYHLPIACPWHVTMAFVDSLCHKHAPNEGGGGGEGGRTHLLLALVI